MVTKVFGEEIQDWVKDGKLVRVVWRHVERTTGRVSEEGYTVEVTYGHKDKHRASFHHFWGDAAEVWNGWIDHVRERGYRIHEGDLPDALSVVGSPRLLQEEAIDLIRGERNYQDSKWPGHAHSVTEYLVYIRDYVEEALHLYSRNDTASVDQQCKANVRKIGALALVCMEQNGAPARS